MPSEKTKILECNQYQNIDQAIFFIYADHECLIEKIDRCKNNPENSSATKLCEHITSGFSMSIISSFKIMKNMYDVYRGKDCTKSFCESQKVHALEIIYFEKKKNNLISEKAAAVI